MPKKGKVNKLAKMSDEERARFLQHRADMEEEARRRKRELIARFIKNKLDREEAYSRMNTAKINQEWRYILRRVKCKQMEADIQGMTSSFNFLMERKDRLIQSLVRSIYDSDDQHRRAFQAHTETLSYFLSIGTQRLDKLQAEYDYQKNLLLESWDKEEFDITDKQYRGEFILRLITYIQNRQFRTYRHEMGLKRATEKNDARLEHEEDLRTISRPKQLEIEMYWTKLRDVYNSYLELHNPIMGHYQSLREKDDFYTKDIARNDLHIQRATDMLMALQQEWMRTTNTIAHKLSKMSRHKDELAGRYWVLKKDNNAQRSSGDSQLTVMVNASQDAITRLEEVKEKLDKIMQMDEICRKYEHLTDESFLKDVEGADDDPIDFENLDGAMVNECKEYSKMDKFMLKVNRVRVQTICLRAEKAKLAKENVQLKLYIKRYLTDLALRGKERPQSMKIQSALQKVDANGKVLNRPVTCIEGALSNAVQHQKRMKILEKRNRDIGGVRAYPRVQCWTAS